LLQPIRDGAIPQWLAPDRRWAEMARIINCECGYVARGETDDEVVADLELHIRQNHPEMVGKYERNQLLDLIEEA
jgi:hypothetical protein